jgi:hypothetical protein
MTYVHDGPTPVATEPSTSTLVVIWSLKATLLEEKTDQLPNASRIVS